MIARRGKRFCSDACRVFYHNSQSSEFNNLKRTINRILSQNRKILKTLVDQQNTRVTEKDLLARGFRFDYFTSQFTTHQLKTYFYSYDYGYCRLEGDKYLIVKSHRKMQ
jgi:hypothetical protein